jgi:monovalent cation:H+ antiporter, CPA1 family
MSARCRVTAHPRRFTEPYTRGSGEFFGEIALIRDTPRTATVPAAEPVQLVVVDRAAFLDSIGAHPRSTHTAHSVAEERLLTAAEAAGV